MEVFLHTQNALFTTNGISASCLVNTNNCSRQFSTCMAINSCFSSLLKSLQFTQIKSCRSCNVLDHM